VFIVDTGDAWARLGYYFINPLGVPLLNSFVLLSRAVTVTWGHFNLLGGFYCLGGLGFTLLLSLYFLTVQGLEYLDSGVSITRGFYGRIFFFSTGFHGLHVVLGRVYLLVNYLRIVLGHYRSFHHLGLEFAILYWHFVDVVWLFLFVFVYWWSY
jgi:cytochrome c oxidase subunit 3